MSSRPYTGNNQPVKNPIVRVYPNLIPPDVETPVTVPPLENGYQPLYVMFSKIREGVKAAGHDYHKPPSTDEITGFSDLKRQQPQTPKQGGSGKRNRWIDSKGRRIYEWDSQHGELEGYRASDGQHIGSFDYKTGMQTKPSVPGRNIKKYL
ncbi:colicin E3/pyocin S6 family cytotoxin [Arsenophonus nasoniae]|uniref:colicin E3/pyocin S6 family cytotoxin n=1 Tax=Arsenophonus nasoniae TaxID=638 RepID=UPI00387A24CF